MQMVAGMALMKPTNFWLEFTLTPQCHWGNQPGGRRALWVGQVECEMHIMARLGKGSTIKTAVKPLKRYELREDSPEKEFR